VNAIAIPPLVLLERTGRWAASLRRHGMVERLTLVETRSFAELDELLPTLPHALVGLEMSRGSAQGVVTWLARHADRQRIKGAIVFAERRYRPMELICREAGAVHFIASELELFALPALFDRYRSAVAASAPMDAERSIAESIRARLPWRE
jgi:hypothetical protein